jgi:hypothetical protein
LRDRRMRLLSGVAQRALPQTDIARRDVEVASKQRNSLSFAGGSVEVRSPGRASHPCSTPMPAPRCVGSRRDRRCRRRARPPLPRSRTPVSRRQSPATRSSASGCSRAGSSGHQSACHCYRSTAWPLNCGCCATARQSHRAQDRTSCGG